MDKTMKYQAKTKLSNITQNKDGSFSYDQELVSLKWGTELDTQPQPLVSVVEKHFSDDLDRCNSGSQIEIPSDKPRDKESI